MSNPLSKADYAKLSPKAKAALKAALQAKAVPRAPRAPRVALAVSHDPIEGRGRGWADFAIEGTKVVAPLVGAYYGAHALKGVGDYAPLGIMPKHNSFMRALLSNGPPAIQNTRMRTFVVRHREYLGDVVTGATGAFNITTFPINPGMAVTFPWLAQLAQNFEQYRINGMVFEFKSTSADALNSTNTALGTVVMATEYNSDSDPFTTKQQMENHEFANSCRQSCSMLHAIECKPSLTSISELYTRTTAPAAGQDLRLYDLGQFSIATVGQQGSSVNIGELWCSYEIELLKPQLPDVSAIVGTDHFYSATGVSTSAYFGTTTTTQADGIGCSVSTDTITFPDNVASGKYLVQCNWYTPGGSGTLCVVPTVSTTNCASFTPFSAETLAALGTGNSIVVAATNAIAHTLAIDISGPGATVTYSGGTLPAGSVRVDLMITRVSDL